MKQIHLTAVLCIGVAAFAQEVRFDYDRSANFSAYKTYEWVDYKPVQIGDELMDRDIKRAVDAQLAEKRPRAAARPHRGRPRRTWNPAAGRPHRSRSARSCRPIPGSNARGRAGSRE